MLSSNPIDTLKSSAISSAFHNSFNAFARGISLENQLVVQLNLIKKITEQTEDVFTVSVTNTTLVVRHDRLEPKLLTSQKNIFNILSDYSFNYNNNR